MAEKLAASKRARVVREKGEFDARTMQALIRPPWSASGAHAWSVAKIVAARDAQMSGRFREPYELARSIGTDGALFTARDVRLAPVQALSVKLEAGRGPRADKIADEADALFGNNGVAISPATLTSLRRQIVDHGVAFGYNDWRVRDDGSRIDVVHKAWPIQHVWWHELANCYVTNVRHVECDSDPTAKGLWTTDPGIGSIEPIVHGDGKWVVYSKSDLMPHTFDGALIPSALVWARRAFAFRDWAKGAASHGNPKVVGKMAEGTPLTDSYGRPTKEAEEFVALLQAIASEDSPVGIQPFGAEVEYLVNSSQAWEVWAKLTETSDRDAARIYLGTDGVLGSQGGAPGVDVSALFGVATSKTQADLEAINRGAQEGVISPWCAQNFGDDKQAPRRSYVFPDPDEAAVRADFAKRNDSFNKDVAAYKANGFVVDQALIDRLAELHGVPAPVLPGAPPSDAAQPAAMASRGHLVPVIRPAARTE